MVSEPGIYSRRLASGLRTQKRERETITLTLEKMSAKRGGLTFSSVPAHEDEVLGVTGHPDPEPRAIVRSERDVMHGVQYSRRPVMSCADEHMPDAGKIGNIFPINNSRQRRARDVRRDQVRSGRCCRSERYYRPRRLPRCRRLGRGSRSGDREDIADRKDVADRKHIVNR
jgi:hypothetical protein